ncbi:hypothetical protein [Limnothrix sp. FACHB-1088]|uniref:hypothetical protein n=1 Tax=Limnothrix sp. FACHB-1088 TaxID=2692816 RepID=UPI001A7ECA3B|nr:hypothetical protein [Limnothrix sp. FACHB-1088]
MLFRRVLRRGGGIWDAWLRVGCGRLPLLITPQITLGDHVGRSRTTPHPAPIGSRSLPDSPRSA